MEGCPSGLLCQRFLAAFWPGALEAAACPRACLSVPMLSRLGVRAVVAQPQSFQEDAAPSPGIWREWTRELPMEGPRWGDP